MSDLSSGFSLALKSAVGIVAVIILAVFTLAFHAHAAQRHGITLRALLADCTIDAHANPAVLTCPAGCTVTISNGIGDGPPRFAVAPACQALR